jgi:hypothetical protein
MIAPSTPFDEAFPMTDKAPRMSVAALAQPAKTAASRTMTMVKLGVLAVSVAAAVPTAQNLYYSYKHGVPFNQVSHRLAQYELWMKNLDCRINYRALLTAGGTKVDVGACPKSGDIAIKVTGAKGQATYEWIAYDNLQKPDTQSAGLMSLFITPALAQDLHTAVDDRTSPVETRLAQSAIEVICQSKVKDSIIRVVRDGDKCYRETVSPFRGSIDEREEVPCDTQCVPAG